MSETQKFYENETLNNPYTLPVSGDFMFQGENWAMFILQFLDKELVEPKNDGVDTDQARILVENFYNEEIEKHKKSILHREWIQQCLIKIKRGDSLGIDYYSGHGVK
jgi:hypothetical protein